jgi:membrane protein involved in colicin uptake
MTPEQANDPEAPPGGVLAGLPRTRPQRTSARREAARARAKSETASPASAGKQGEARAAAKAKTRTSAKPKTRASAKPKVTPKAKPKAAIAKKPVKPAGAKLRAAAKTEEPAPKQGYESEEVELGNTVNPPSGIELVESVADIFGELANSGLAAGGRILKDAFSRLRRP